MGIPPDNPRKKYPVTEPIEPTVPLPPEMPPSYVPQGFEPLTPEELTPDQRHWVRMYVTALVAAEKVLNRKERGERPVPYQDRFYIWKMLRQQLLLALVMGPLVALTIFLRTVDTVGVSDWLDGTLVLLLLFWAWSGCRVYFDWHRTILFSNVEETGIRRPRNRWLLLTDKEVTVDTASLHTKDALRGNFASFFNLNCWRVSLDSPSQRDEALNALTFVRYGDKLKETIMLNKSYLS